MYRDYITKYEKRLVSVLEDQAVPGQIEGMVQQEKKWLQSHLISYTFNQDEFLPNPDAVFFLKN